MLFDYFDDLNWLAVVVAGLAFFAFGAIWYSNALFGKQYRAAIGQDPEGNPTPPAGKLVVNLILWVVAALALALIAEGIGAETFWDGVVLGLVASLGFIGTNRVVAGMFEGGSTALMRVNAPYTIIGYMIMGVILAMWQ